MPLVIPLSIQAPLAYLAALGFRYRSVRREREAIRNAFGYFLPAAVVDRLAKGLGPIIADNQLVYGARSSPPTWSSTPHSRKRWRPNPWRA